MQSSSFLVQSSSFLVQTSPVRSPNSGSPHHNVRYAAWSSPSRSCISAGPPSATPLRPFRIRITQLKYKIHHFEYKIHHFEYKIRHFPDTSAAASAAASSSLFAAYELKNTARISRTTLEKRAKIKPIAPVPLRSEQQAVHNSLFSVQNPSFFQYKIRRFQGKITSAHPCQAANSSVLVQSSSFLV